MLLRLYGVFKNKIKNGRRPVTSLLFAHKFLFSAYIINQIRVGISFSQRILKFFFFFSWLCEKVVITYTFAGAAHIAGWLIQQSINSRFAGLYQGQMHTHTHVAQAWELAHRHIKGRLVFPPAFVSGSVIQTDQYPSSSQTIFALSRWLYTRNSRAQGVLTVSYIASPVAIPPCVCTQEKWSDVQNCDSTLRVTEDSLGARMHLKEMERERERGRSR